MDEGVSCTKRQPCPFLDIFIRKSVQFLEICGSDVVYSEEEPDGGKEIFVINLQFIFRSIFFSLVIIISLI